MLLVDQMARVIAIQIARPSPPLLDIDIQFFMHLYCKYKVFWGDIAELIFFLRSQSLRQLRLSDGGEGEKQQKKMVIFAY